MDIMDVIGFPKSNAILGLKFQFGGNGECYGVAKLVVGRKKFKMLSTTLRYPCVSFS